MTALIPVPTLMFIVSLDVRIEHKMGACIVCSDTGAHSRDY